MIIHKKSSILLQRNNKQDLTQKQSPDFFYVNDHLGCFFIIKITIIKTCYILLNIFRLFTFENIMERYGFNHNFQKVSKNQRNIEIIKNIKQNKYVK